jgi:hypothetical protein
VTFHWNFAEDGERIKRLRGISIFPKVFKFIQGDRFSFALGDWTVEQKGTGYRGQNKAEYRRGNRRKRTEENRIQWQNDREFRTVYRQEESEMQRTEGNRIQKRKWKGYR